MTKWSAGLSSTLSVYACICKELITSKMMMKVTTTTTTVMNDDDRSGFTP